MNSVSKKQFSNGVKWKTINLVLSKGLSFIASIIIARLIEPEHYGYMAIWSVILSFCDVIVIGGLDTVLVQKEKLQDEEWKTGFTFSLYKAIVISLIIIGIAPYIAEFYNIPELNLLIKISCIDLIAQPFIFTGVAKCSRKLDFKKIFFSDFVATCFGAIVSLICIYGKKNVLVLILNNMVHQAIYGLLLIILQRDKIGIGIKKSSLKSIYFDGVKAMSNGVLDLFTSSINNLYMGKKWTPIEVGYNNRAQSLVQILGVETYNVISNILLPTFSSYQSQKDKLKGITRIMVSLSTYIMFPLMFGTAVCAKNIILFLFTEKWIQAVPFLQIACIYYAFNPLRQLCMNLNYSYGGYKNNNIIEIIRFILTVTVIVVFQVFDFKSFNILVLCGAITTVIIAIIYIYSVVKIINYSLLEIIEDIIPNLIMTVITLLPLYYISYRFGYGIVVTFAQVLLAVVIYIFLSFISKNKIFVYLIISFEEIIKKKWTK